MSIRSFKVFVRYELDGEEKEFFFFTTVDELKVDSVVDELINKGKSMMKQSLAWDLERLTSFKVWWTDGLKVRTQQSKENS